MKIQQYVGSLLPSLAKDEILDDIKVTRKEISETTIEAYRSVLPVMSSWKFQSERVKVRVDAFGGAVKKGNPLVTISQGLPAALQNLDQVEDLVKATFNEDAASSGLTFLKAQALQFVECIAFVSKFARKFVDYVMVLETAELGTEVGISLSPAEMEWIEKNFMSFCTAFEAATAPHANVKKALAEIPDIAITPQNVETLPATVGDKKLDPLSMRLIPVWLNPVYHIGMVVAEWQADRYKAAKEELRLIQLRKMNLELLSKGKADAKIQKEVEYLESRVQTLNYRIAQMEAKNA